MTVDRKTHLRALKVKADLYAALGIEPGASPREIRSAYLKLVKELHPDGHFDNPEADERLKAVNRAYHHLRALEEEVAERVGKRVSGIVTKNRATSRAESAKMRVRRRRVALPPGAHLNAFASFVFRKRVYETVFRPYLAEMQEEYFEALKNGSRRKAQWVHIRGVAGFWSTVALQLPVSLAKVIKRLWTVAGG